MQSYCFVGARGKRGQTGTYGIDTCLYNAETGQLTSLFHIASEINVGALYLDRGILYCTDERTDLPGRRIGGGGQIYAYSIDPETGALCQCSRCPSYGPMPADVVSVGDYVLAVNHSTKDGHITYAERDATGAYQVCVRMDESSLVLFRREVNGAVGAPLDIWKASGEGPLDGIQLGPHLHCVKRSSSGEQFLVCDKGSDRIYLFRVEQDRLVAGPPYQATPGDAPRYGVFHPTESLVFVNNEFKPKLYSFRYGPDGALTLLDCAEVLPSEVAAPKKHGQSDIVISADGNYIYDLFRQVDRITVFRVDRQTGALTRIQSMQAEGTLLRSCALSPDGKFLMVVCNESGTVLAYPVQPDGTLGPPAKALERTGVANIVFYQAK